MKNSSVIQVAIYGASGCGRSVMPLAREQWAKSGESFELSFVDDNSNLKNANGHDVLSYSQWLLRPARERYIAIAISNSLIREKLVSKCESDGIKFFDVCASNVVQMDAISLGNGSILCPFVTLTSNIKIGKHFHANIYSYVEHDCIIGDFVTFAPSVQCNGNVHIGDHAYLGAGAIIKNGNSERPLIIGAGAFIGMGAVVTKDVQPGEMVIGLPARPI